MEPNSLIIKNYNFLGDELDTAIKLVKIERKSSYDSGSAHRHNYNELFFFVEGGGEHMIDFNTHIVKPNSFHSVSANKVHLLKREPDSCGFVLLLKTEFFQYEILRTNYAFLLSCAKVNLPQEVFKELIELLYSIEKELKIDNVYSNEVVVALVNLMLMKLKQAIKLGDEYEKVDFLETKLFKEFYFLLERDFTTERKVAHYAHKLNFSVSVLNKELLKNTGKTAAKLIQDRLLLECKRLLFHSDLSIKEIAFNLNFTDSAHFSRFFTKHMNCSPSNYRAQYDIYK